MKKILKYISTLFLLCVPFFIFGYFYSIGNSSKDKITTFNSEMRSLSSKNISSSSYASSFKTFMEKTRKNGGHALYSIYKAIGDNSVLNENDALKLNEGDKKDLLIKLKYKNKEYVNKNLVGLKNSLNLSSSNFDGINLMDLDFMSILKNLQSLTIKDNSTNSNDSLQIMDKNDFTWINNLSDLEYIKIINYPKNSLSKPISMSENIFTSRKLINIDLSKVLYFDGVIKSMFNGFNEDQFWYANKPKGFELKLSRNNISQGKLINTDVKIEQNGGIILTKKIGSQIHFLNLKNNDQKYISIDDIKYPKVLYENSFMWDVPLNILSKVKYCNPVNGGYYTILKPNNVRVSKTIIPDLYIKTKQQANLLFNKSINLETDISKMNSEESFKLLGDVIYLDGLSKSRFLQNNMLYWDIDPKEIKFASSDLKHFWTNSKLLTKEDFEKYNISYYRNISSLKNWHKLLINNNSFASNPNQKVFYNNAIELKPYFNNNISKYMFPLSVYKEIMPNSIDKFKYYSQKDGVIFSSLNLLKKSGLDIKDFIELPEVPMTQNLNIDKDIKNRLYNIVKHKDVIDFISKNINSSDYIKKMIQHPFVNIDGKNIGLFLRENKFYFQFPISKIKYIISENGVKKYYTNWELIPSNLKDKSKIYISHRSFLPRIKKIIHPSIVDASHYTISIMSNNQSFVINVGLNNGKLIWDFRDKNISIEDIKFVDADGNYYAMSIDEIMKKYNVLPTGLSTVIKEKNIQISNLEKSSLLKPFFNKGNFDLIMSNEYIVVDNVKYFRKINDSNIHWLSKNGVLMDISKIHYQFITTSIKGKTETNQFYTSIKNAKYFSNNFPLNLREIQSYTETLFKPDIKKINPPTSINQKLKIHDGLKKIIFNAINDKDSNSGLVWSISNDDLVKRIKFMSKNINNEVEYYTTIPKVNFDENKEWSDVKADISNLGAKKREEKKDLILDNNLPIKIFAFIFIGLISILALASIYILIKKKRG
ncbi:hypothetical protein [Mycoplasma marinum]|uniref:Uncharacterized protein n=1 Tax=Mycoplasma marinum TaxID=1937190 RepID=A0A4R0XV43_9MOLU|nr:hypothetical protein [Mycoplasma marinum]TCG11700.1 hypothetical protein C4B24_00915 [Mycoplasma marinum]